MLFDGSVKAAIEQGLELGLVIVEMTGFGLETEDSMAGIAASRQRKFGRPETATYLPLTGLEQANNLLVQPTATHSRADALMPSGRPATQTMLQERLVPHTRAEDFTEAWHRHGNHELGDSPNS